MATWVSDTDFVGGVNQQAPTIKLASVNSPPIEVLRTVRVGPGGFVTLRPARKELVRITFADVTSTDVGQNKQSAMINGNLYISDLDVFAQTGSVSCVVRDVVIQQPAGNVVIGFTASVGQTQIAALEFLDGGNLPLSQPVTPAGPGEEPLEIPTDGIKWLREVWNNTDLTGSSLLQEIIAGPNIDYEFANSAPAAGFGENSWSQRFSRYATLTAGNYVGYLRGVDDGGRLKVDGLLVQAKIAGTATNAESWVQQPPSNYDLPFTVATTHAVLEVVEHNDYQYTAGIHYNRAAAGAPVPTPPVPPTGTVLLGSKNSASDADSLYQTEAFDALVGKYSTMPMTYVVSSDMYNIGRALDWLDANGAKTVNGVNYPARKLKYSINFLKGEAGQFGSSTPRSEATTIAQAIEARGLGSRILVRHMYEFNAPYGFEWMPLSHGGQFAAATDLYRDIVDNMRAACPTLTFDWCVVPWHDDPDNYLSEVWPGGAWVDVVGLDVYNSDGVSGDEATRWAVVGQRLANGIAWARTHGKPWALDEWANRSGSWANGGGDDPTFIREMLTQVRTAGDCHSADYFNTPHETGLEFGPSAPRMTAEYQYQMTLFT